MSAVDIDHGWTDFGGSSRKFHYVPQGDREALCKKWAVSPFVQRSAVRFSLDVGANGDGLPGSDDCKACYRKLHPS